MATVEENILHSLEKNGFPVKKVSLPFKALFKACKQEEISLTDVLNKLEAKEIKHIMKGDKILFYASTMGEPPDSVENLNEFDFSNKMVKEAMEKLGEMAPDELERLKEQVANMSPEQKNDLLKQAKNLFKKPD